MEEKIINAEKELSEAEIRLCHAENKAYEAGLEDCRLSGGLDSPGG